MSFVVHEKPYRSLAESVVTSNYIDMRDSYQMGLTAYISSGTSSIFTIQITSHQSAIVDSQWSSIPEAAWSNWTVCVAPSGMSASAVAYELPTDFPLARIIRTVSNASFVIDTSKQVYA